MTTQAETREPEMGLTFEKVWAMFRESDRRMRESKEETDRVIQETARKIRESKEETDRRMKETDRVIQDVARQIKETDRQIKETARQMKETDRKMKKTDEQLGKLGNRFGELAEHLVAPNIVKKFNALGFHFDEISGLRRVIYDDKSGQKIAEFDIILENGESIVGVEVKSKPSNKDVKDHLRRLRILRLNKDKKNDRRKIHGALAGAIMTDSVKKAAIEAGIYVITQTGDTVKIDIPEGFVPRTW
ncbi:MAG: hypothetical protein LBE65_04480 [Synergistaceae bacterium]|jgi:hypothetical protein|nr:hypothetical protein [Synergistaceae bacterium]